VNSLSVVRQDTYTEGLEQDTRDAFAFASREVAVFLATFKSTSNIRDRFSKNPQIPKFMKIRQVEAEIFHADGQT
jgi:hypothetical protein